MDIGSVVLLSAIIVNPISDEYLIASNKSAKERNEVKVFLNTPLEKINSFNIKDIAKLWDSYNLYKTEEKKAAFLYSTLNKDLIKKSAYECEKKDNFSMSLSSLKGKQRNFVDSINKARQYYCVVAINANNYFSSKSKK